MQDNKPKPTITVEQIKQYLLDAHIGYESDYILRQADKEITEKSKQIGKGGKREVTSDTNYYKAMTLFEFDKGVLLANAIPEWFKVFGLDFSKNLQTEYGCITPSEKSLAEIISLNFMRILTIQIKINSYLGLGTMSETGVKYLAVLSKELDRAERHYLASLQALRSLRMPPLEVNIKTQTAIVGQNQIVQANNNDKPI